MSRRTIAQPPPDPPNEYDAPEGFEYVWEPVSPDDCRVARGDERGRMCRRPGCRRPPAIALMRRNGWWLYCDWHTYGRRVERAPDGTGVVLRRVARQIEGTS
jgi:hypothetical protein